MFKKTNLYAASAMALACLGFTFPSHATEVVAPAAKTEQEAASLLPAQDMEGNWGGLLAGHLRLNLQVKKSPDGGYTSVLESIDQGHAMIPVDKLEVSAGHLSLKVAAVHGSYDATWDDKAKAWVGTWTQGQALPLTLVRVNGEIPRATRPQEHAIETEPLPYSQELVTFDGAAAGVQLAGTFSLPQGKGPFPAVVLVAGSGPQTRDEDVEGHKVFLVLSDYLTRRGIAVLRYDKRGIGKSSGDYEAATTVEFTADAEAAVAYLRSRHDVDVRHVGLIGHSEGGLIAPAVAAEDAKVGFIVLLAGPAIRGDKLLAQQMYLIGKASGLPEEKGVANRKINGEIFTAIAAAPNEAEARATAVRLYDKAVQEHRVFGDVDKAKANLPFLTSAWMRYFLGYDPVPTLRRVSVPVLALNGSLDLQVPPKEDLEIIKDALRNDADVTLMELPKLNHLFQSASTGTPAEYGTIEETFNAAALTILGDWVSVHVK